MFLFVRGLGCGSIFLLEDSSSNGSDIKNILHDNDVENLILLAVMKAHEDGKKRKRQGSMIMIDLFAEICTYPTHLFRMRYRICRELFP
jgi:hypothetical protein